MPSAPQPDAMTGPRPADGPRPGAEETGEVVEVFTGESLEEAMAAAVAALGPDLHVRRARKVRSGVRGLMGKDRYEVLAVPAAGPRSSPEAVTAALEGLLERAESEESASRPGQPAAAPAPAPTRTPAPGPSLRRSTPVAAPRRASDLAEQLPHPQPDLAEHGSAAPRPAAPEPAPGPAAAPSPARWSRARLLEIGVPPAVVAALPDEEPTDDIGWLVALTAAIEATVPPHATADADHPAVLDGHGTPGALALLDAGVRGIPPGALTVAGRTVAAGAVELAIAVRAAVLP